MYERQEVKLGITFQGMHDVLNSVRATDAIRLALFQMPMPCRSAFHTLRRKVLFLVSRHIYLVHLADELVDVLLTVTEVTSLNEVEELALVEATGWVRELEWPEEVGGLLEVWSDLVDLVDQVFHADNTVLAKVLLNDGVVGKRDAVLLAGLGVSALVDELTNRLQVGVTVGDEWLDDLEHLRSGLGQANEDTVVDLKETEKLEGLALLWVDLVDTLDADNEGELWLGWDVVGALRLGHARETNLLALLVAVLLHVGLGTLEDLSTLLLVLLFINSQQKIPKCPSECIKVRLSSRSVPKDG